MEVEAGLGEGAGTMLLVLGDYWQPDRDERTEIGELVRRAKDQGDPGAASELAERFASLATALPEASGGLPRLVVPVPSGPGPAGDGGPAVSREDACVVAGRRGSRGVPAEPRGEEHPHASHAPRGARASGRGGGVGRLQGQ